MAIDFSQVKTITIPEGSVKKITDSAGAVLWQEESGSWHTIFKSSNGPKTCSVAIPGGDGTGKPVLKGAEDNFAQTKSGTGYTPKIRIKFYYTYSLNENDPFKYAYIINDKWNYGDYYPPDHTITFETVPDSTDSVILLGSGCKHESIPELYGYAGIRKRRDTENNRIIFDMYPYVSSNVTSQNSDFWIDFKVTKIEQYY